MNYKVEQMLALNDLQSVNDFKVAARRRLPKFVYEFVDKGCEDEICIRENREAIESVKFIPRVGLNVANRDLSINLLGQNTSLPLIIAPTGSAGLLWYKGEVALAKAAKAKGIPFTLATGSISSIEEVRDEAGGRLWFQLYLWPERALSYALIDRAEQAGYETLVVTLDTPILPNREADRRNHFSIPFRATAKNVMQMAAAPDWLFRTMGTHFLKEGMPRPKHYPLPPTDANGARRAGLSDTVTWDEIKLIRERWKGKLLIKGILHPDDAVIAISCGADGVIVSNHGGRNFDSALPTFTVLPMIVEAVKGRAAVIVDSGIRRGDDILKAIALGADAVQIGRAALYGIGAAGEAGASKVLDLLRMELDTALASCGLRDYSGADRTVYKVKSA